MNIKLLKSIECAHREIQIASAFAAKYDIPEDIASFFISEMGCEVTIYTARLKTEDANAFIAKAGELFGADGWAVRNMGHRIDWYKKVDGVRIKIAGAEPVLSTNDAVPAEKFTKAA